MQQTLPFTALFSDNPKTANERPPARASFLDLIAPCSIDEFTSCIDERRALYLPASSSEVEGLLDLMELRDALWRSRDNALAAAGGLLLRVDSGGRAEPLTSDRQRHVTYGEIGPELDAGATLCVSNLQLISPAMARLAASAQRETQFAGRVGVNCYLSSDGCGFDAHFDARIVTVVQLQGSKVWRYSERVACSYPVAGARLVAGEVVAAECGAAKVLWAPSERDWKQVELRPGDVLCLPAGAWHAAKAADGMSLALNVYFEHPSFFETVDGLLQEHIPDPSVWRSGPPCGRNQTEVERYYRERLREAAELLHRLAGDPLLIAGNHCAEVQRAALSAYAVAGDSTTAEEWDRERELRINDGVPVRWCYGRPELESDEAFLLFIGHQRLVLTREAGPHVVRLLEATSSAALRRIAEQSPPGLVSVLLQLGALQLTELRVEMTRIPSSPADACAIEGSAHDYPESLRSVASPAHRGDVP